MPFASAAPRPVARCMRFVAVARVICIAATLVCRGTAACSPMAVHGPAAQANVPAASPSISSVRKPKLEKDAPLKTSMPSNSLCLQTFPVNKNKHMYCFLSKKNSNRHDTCASPPSIYPPPDPTRGQVFPGSLTITPTYQVLSGLPPNPVRHQMYTSNPATMPRPLHQPSPLEVLWLCFFSCRLQGCKTPDCNHRTSSDVSLTPSAKTSSN